MHCHHQTRTHTSFQLSPTPPPPQATSPPPPTHTHTRARIHTLAHTPTFTCTNTEVAGHFQVQAHPSHLTPPNLPPLPPPSQSPLSNPTTPTSSFPILDKKGKWIFWAWRATHYCITTEPSKEWCWLYKQKKKKRICQVRNTSPSVGCANNMHVPCLFSALNQTHARFLVFLLFWWFATLSHVQYIYSCGCVCVHVYMQVCVCACIMCVFVCMWMTGCVLSVYMFVCMTTHMHHPCVCVCVHVCVCVRARVHVRQTYSKYVWVFRWVRMWREDFSTHRVHTQISMSKLYFSTENLKTSIASVCSIHHILFLPPTDNNTHCQQSVLRFFPKSNENKQVLMKKCKIAK